MSELRIEISPDVISKLNNLRDRVNQNIAPAIKLGKDRRVSISQVASALVSMQIIETSADKTIFAVMVARDQLKGEKWEK